MQNVNILMGNNPVLYGINSFMEDYLLFEVANYLKGLKNFLIAFMDTDFKFIRTNRDIS